MEVIMPAYKTMEEYHCLMMEAQIEYYLWEEEKKVGRKADKVKHNAIRLAKLDARKAFTDALDIEVA